MMDRSIGAALLRARNTAMSQAVTARVPECGRFGDIAQDLDWVCSEMGIGGQAFCHKERPSGHGDFSEWVADVVEKMGASGYDTLAIASFIRTSVPGSEPPGDIK